MPKPMAKISFTYPHLHGKVIQAVADQMGKTPWFNNGRNKRAPTHEYSTNVMGRFTCNNGCPRSTWTSKKVAIVIRGYAENGYSAIVFNQRCKSCEQLGRFTLDQQSYIERIAYRLKKWAGVEVELPYYEGTEGPPHVQELCEGCKRGYCQKISGTVP